MKARSVVFTHVQFPVTIFGLPPVLAVLSAAAGTVAFVVAILAGAVPIAMIAMVVVAVPLLVKSYRLGRADRHVESVVLTSVRFWRFSSARGLPTGAFPQRSQDGGRS